MLYFAFIGFDRLNSMSFEELHKEIIDGNMGIGEVWCWALKCGRLDIVKGLSSKVEECPGLIEIVAENGHLEMLTWLYNNRNEYYTGRAIYLAAANGHLEVLQFLYNNLSYLSSLNFGGENHINNAINAAASNGHLSVVKWLYYNTDVIITDPMIVEKAKFHNHTRVANWLEDEVCGR